MPNSVWEKVGNEENGGGGRTFDVVKSYSGETRILQEQLSIVKRKIHVFLRRLYFRGENLFGSLYNDLEFTTAVFVFPFANSF